ncbi:MAG: alpha-L-fucosidase [bacterium]
MFLWKRNKTMIVLWICFSIGTGVLPAYTQQNPAGEGEIDPLVLEKLEWFQDAKFGLLMHWGPYSQWGVVESWSICSEDKPFCRRHIDDYTEYKKQYENLKTTFNPKKFNPNDWAQAAQYAGMKYVIFTTKHHDGFCMFDTKQTDYRITDSDCPFHVHPKANVTKEIFNTFRKNGFGIGAYFSKADWHTEYYWWPRFATPDRNVNYDTAKYPERWKRFCEFTYNQIEELMTGYGPVDILWLDGGWVRPKSTISDRNQLLNRNLLYDQNIDMPRIASMARTHQPGLIIVDRTVTGKYENYRTPEQRVPDKPLDYPWETCMTMASSWSYVPDDNYKSARTLVHMLVDIVAKGGNLLLNIGPDANGEWAPDAYDRLQEIGDWMKANGEAIYGTRPVAPYKETKICFTSKKDVVYAIYLADEDELNPPPKIMLYSHCPKKSGKITLLGTQNRLEWEPSGKGVLIHVPESAIKNPPCSYAWAFKIERGS